MGQQRKGGVRSEAPQKSMGELIEHIIYGVKIISIGIVAVIIAYAICRILAAAIFKSWHESKGDRNGTKNVKK